MGKLSSGEGSKPAEPKRTAPYKDELTNAWVLPGWNDKAVVETFRYNASPMLFYALGSFWEGQTGGGYAPLTTDKLKGKLATWLEGQRKQGLNKKVGPYPINDRHINELVSMLRSICNNGCSSTGVDLSTGAMLPYIPLQDKLYNPTTKQTAKYNIDHFMTWKLPFTEEELRFSKCEKWIAFLEQGFPRHEDIAILQEWFGYCLKPVADLQRCLWLYGLRGSGKTIITKVLCAMLGESNIWAGTARDLGAKFNSDVRNKRLLLLPDFRVRNADNAQGLQFILNIVGGDHVRVEQKNEDSITMMLNCWVMFHSNELPSFPDSTGAAMRRIIPLHRQGTWENAQDPRLYEEKLLPELPGIFGWALRGYDRLISRGDFDKSMFDKRLLDNSARTTNPLMAFVSDWCEVDETREGTQYIHIEDLFDCYQSWCSKTRTKMSFNQEMFATAMMQSVHVLKRLDRDGKRGFLHIKIKEGISLV